MRLIPLAHAPLVPRDDVGNKAASLGIAAALGCAVPDGYVIGASHFHDFVDHAAVRGKLTLLERSLHTLAPTHVRNIAAEIESRLRATTSPSLTAAVHEAFDLLGGGPLVCRSSSVLEDRAGQSFPGVFLTVRGIRDVQALYDAALDCYCSLLSERALAYASRSVAAPRFVMPLIVQREVLAAAAGVVFTRDPIRGEEGGAVVEVVEGHGDAFVSGRTGPFRYRRDRDSGWMLEPAPTEASRPPLDDIVLERLHERCLTLAHAFGTDVDVEFATNAGTVEPWILQCRPAFVTPRERAATTGHVLRSLAGATCSAVSASGTGIDLRAFRGSYEMLRGRIGLLPSLSVDDLGIALCCAGIVTEQRDALLAHPAIACRELGLPYITAVAGACDELDGLPLLVDGSAGVVHVLAEAQSSVAQKPAAADQEVHEPQMEQLILELLHCCSSKLALQRALSRTLPDVPIDTATLSFTDEEAALIRRFIPDLLTN